jgi:chromosome segregation ATPase
MTLHVILTYVQKATTQLRTMHESMVEAEIRLTEAKSELNTLKSENREILQKLQAKKAEIKTLEEQLAKLSNEYQRMMQTVQADLASLTPDERTLMKELRELPTLEALELQVQDVDTRLEMMADGNPGAIKAFEKREADITKTKEKIESLEATLESTKDKITDIRQKWEPELDALIRKISDAFAHNLQEIGCAGEVEVYKDEDNFDKWSAQISVRFR